MIKLLIEGLIKGGSIAQQDEKTVRAAQQNCTKFQNFYCSNFRWKVLVVDDALGNSQGEGGYGLRGGGGQSVDRNARECHWLSRH